MDVQSIIESWEIDEPKYIKLGKLISDFLKDKITEYEILPEIHYRTKELISIIKKIKKKQREKEYSYDKLKDKLGLRIICDFQHEITILDELLKQNFKILDVEYKREQLDFNTLDYVSNHYDVSIDTTIEEFQNYEEFSELVFEIQVRTLNQHAWSNTAHKLSYKRDQDLPNKLKRKIYRLLSLYEIADDEFSSVHTALASHKEKNVFKLLNRLEGKFFKFAKMDFDRETSISSIEKIFNFFSEEKEIISMIGGIEKFINENEPKINQIYRDNKKRLYEVLLLTQPEIFIIFYMLENHTFILEDNWCRDFTIEDLTNAKTLWGNQL